MNEKIEKKRIRGTNFTPEEELDLIQNIVNFQHIIESKELNASTRNEKDAAWAQISQIFNSKFSPRTIHQLRSKYDNMKTLARRLISEKRNNVINFSSYNSANNIRSNIAMNIVLSIINKKPDNTADTVINCNPDELHFSEESSSFSDNSIKPVINEIKIKSENENNECYYTEKSTTEEIIPISLTTKPTTLIINTPAEINKNLERKASLLVTTPISDVPENSLENGETNSTDKNQKVIKKRNPKFQEFLRVKTEYLKRKIALIDLENEERVKRMKHEDDIYAMKMRIMMLDISIKEEELKKLQRI